MNKSLEDIIYIILDLLIITGIAFLVYTMLKKPDGRVDDLGSTPIYGVYDAPGHPWDGKPCNRYDRDCIRVVRVPKRGISPM
tara:strand:- start:25 stop:270 length:246 start_codon:yes stop_codon:yes gene_type:complete